MPCAAKVLHKPIPRWIVAQCTGSLMTPVDNKCEPLPRQWSDWEAGRSLTTVVTEQLALSISVSADTDATNKVRLSDLWLYEAV